MSEIKNDFNECCSSCLMLCGDFFSEGIMGYLTHKTASEVQKFPIFDSLFPNVRIKTI